MPDRTSRSSHTPPDAVPRALLTRGDELVRFLRFHKEFAWADWLEARLGAIRANRRGALRELLDGFNGMANIGDVFLCREAGHRVARTREKGINEQYLVMLSKLYQLARDARDVRASYR